MTLQAIASISWISNLLTAAEQQSMARKTLRALAGIAVHELDAGFGLTIQTGYTHNDPACAIEDASRPHKIKNNWWLRSWTWLCRIAGACIIGIRGLVVLFAGSRVIGFF